MISHTLPLPHPHTYSGDFEQELLDSTILIIKRTEPHYINPTPPGSASASSFFNSFLLSPRYCRGLQTSCPHHLEFRQGIWFTLKLTREPFCFKVLICILFKKNPDCSHYGFTSIIQKVGANTDQRERRCSRGEKWCRCLYWKLCHSRNAHRTGNWKRMEIVTSTVSV